MKCKFEGIACSGFIKKYWAEKIDGSFMTVWLCGGCYNAANTASGTVFEHMPASQWIREMYNRICGGSDEK